MKQLLQVNTNGVLDGSQSILLVEVGERHFYFGILSQASKELQQAGFYSLEERDEELLPEKIFEKHPELQGSFYQIIICYHFSQSLLVPDKYYKYEKTQTLLDNMYGLQKKSVIISEALPEWQLYNIYQVPQSIHELMSTNFSGGKFWHVYSVGLKNISLLTEEPTQIMVDFKPEELTVIVVKDGVLLLAQIFTYETPEDVVYYLLKICNELAISQKLVKIILGGLIDEQSAVYRELHKYFLNLQFSEPPVNIRWHENFKEHPRHFFSSIYNLATCVS